MNRRAAVSCLSSAAIVLVGVASAGATTAPGADEIVARSDRLLGGPSFASIARFQVIRDGEVQSEYEAQSYHSGKEKMLMVFTSPARVKGQAILRNGENQWLYFPNTKKAMKVSSRQPLFGSDFSYGDVLNLDLAKEYAAAVVEGDGAGPCSDCFVLDLTARAPTSTYDRVAYVVRKEDYAPVRRDFFTKSGVHLKTLTFSECDREHMPTRWEMTSRLHPGNVTIMRIERVERRVIPDELFTLNYLRRAL